MSRDRLLFAASLTHHSFEEDELRRLERELELANGQVRAVQNRLKEAELALSRFEKERTDFKIALQRAQRAHDAAQDEYDNNVVEDGRLETLKKMLDEKSQEKRVLEQQWQENRISKDAAHDRLKSATNGLKQVDRNIAVAEERIREAEVHLQAAEDERLKTLSGKNEAIAAEQKAQAALDEFHAHRRNQAGRVQQFSAYADRVGPRVPVASGENAGSLDQKIVKLQDEIRRSEARLVWENSVRVRH